MEIKKVTPFLWFNNQAEEAAKLYCTIFKNSKIIRSSPMDAVFEIEGQRFMAGNFGPQFKLNEAFSIFVTCDSQEEVDYYWTKLTENSGQESKCGWLKDKFGVSWQIVPDAFIKMVSGTDQVRTQRVFAAMMQMSKMEIKKLQEAYDGK